MKVFTVPTGRIFVMDGPFGADFDGTVKEP